LGLYYYLFKMYGRIMINFIIRPFLFAQKKE